MATDGASIRQISMAFRDVQFQSVSGQFYVHSVNVRRRYDRSLNGCSMIDVAGANRVKECYWNVTYGKNVIYAVLFLLKQQ